MRRFVLLSLACLLVCGSRPLLAADEYKAAFECIGTARAAIGNKEKPEIPGVIGPYLDRRGGMPGARLDTPKGSFFLEFPDVVRQTLEDRDIELIKRNELYRQIHEADVSHREDPGSPEASDALRKAADVSSNRLIELQSRIARGWIFYIQLSIPITLQEAFFTVRGEGPGNALALAPLVGGGSADFGLRAGESDAEIGTPGGFAGIRRATLAALRSVAALTKKGKIHQGLVYHTMTACRKAQDDAVTEAVEAVNRAEAYREGHGLGMPAAKKTGSDGTTLVK